jgi:hypothetical protein
VKIAGNTSSQLNKKEKDKVLDEVKDMAVLNEEVIERVKTTT